MLGDDLFGITSNLVPSEGQIIANKKKENYKEDIREYLKRKDVDCYTVACNWIPLGKLPVVKIPDYVRDTVIKAMPPFKKTAIDELLAEGYKLIHVMDWNTPCKNSAIIEQGFNPVFVVSKVTV